ncbi:uncharacterized protein LOC133433760 isoform X2 [Cololabis saira]|nr:uncharacterized protein LOC133433760 isoform X2 [Cololabis saira]XP_061572987.1 uncharacterized protein LOC133433760 isoform X2 [Cololabis saira]
MDSQLASVLTSGSLEVQNGSQRGETPGQVAGFFMDSKDKILSCTKPGNLKSCPVKAAVTISQDALSINRKKPEVGGTSKPATQETSKIGGFKQPIAAKAGVPVLRRQPIRIKIVVPSRCKRQISNPAIRLAKDCAVSHFQGPVLVSAGAVTAEKNKSQICLSVIKKEGEIMEVTCQTNEEKAEANSFQDTERGDELREESNIMAVRTAHTDGSETNFNPSTNTAEMLSHQLIKEETTERGSHPNIPLILQEIAFESGKTFYEVELEEQTEPLDLSSPEKREARERRCGLFLDGPSESSLIMEVDEYEGEGERDTVEEDSEEELCLNSRGMSSPFFSTSVLTSPSSLDCDTENLLLIDDQGIPYTLTPEGRKVPQVNVSTSEDALRDQATSSEVEEEGSLQLATLSNPIHSQSSDNALNAPSNEFYSSTGPYDLSSQVTDQTEAAEVCTSLMTDSDPSAASESNVDTTQEANAILPPSSGIPLSTQPIQILTHPSTDGPLLLLSSSSSSSQLSSAPVSLSLPLSVTSPGVSTPMFLLLSTVPSSSDDSTSTSTPIAVLDPSTGQLSQITAASAPVYLPLSSGQVSSLGSPLPTLSHPIIRLNPNNAPFIMSGINSITPGSVLSSLAVPSSTFALQDDHPNTTPLVQTQISDSESNSGNKAISAEDVSNENDKPSTFAASSPPPQLTSYDSLAQPTPEAQSPASDTRFESSDLPSEHLPWDDHLYFSNALAPPSPPTGLILPSGKLDSLDSLDPLSPAESPTTLGSRRVLCCQLCPRIFFYLSDLERHAITHSQKKPHVCQQCGKAFKRSSHLQRHKHIHTGQRNFVCPICAKRFREAGELQRHQRVHTGEKPYQCQLCHTRFAERNTLRRHTKRKHPYHQVAMEMLNERRDKGGGRGDGGGGGMGVQEEEESAEWYSSTVSTLDNSESEMET